MIFTLYSYVFCHKIQIYNFDPYNVCLAITTNIPQRLKTGFVVQGHILLFYIKRFARYCWKKSNLLLAPHAVEFSGTRVTALSCESGALLTITTFEISCAA